MEYSKAMELLDQFKSGEIRLGLERIRLLLEKMGNPQNELNFIHIAGTNGKGSTAKMLSNILSAANYKTGLYLSPYVLDFREQMQIDGEMIAKAEFAECAKYAFSFLDYEKPNELPSHFEIQTAIAFEWYKRNKCDYVVLEVGLGGSEDATNVIPAPILQIITSISFDHTSFLGDTLEQIATQKAGIIKGGTTVVYPKTPETVVEVIARRCAITGGKYVLPDLDKLQMDTNDWHYFDFSYENVAYRKSLIGEFQVYNCLVVIEAVKQLIAMGVAITPKQIRSGLENTYFPARMEVLGHQPLVILDGSHNPSGAKALERSLIKMDKSKVTILMGVMADKDYDTILSSLCPHATRFVAVAPDNPRALSEVDLARAAAKYCDDVKSYENISVAVDQTLADLESDDILIVCGSLYLALAIRPILIAGLK